MQNTLLLTLALLWGAGCAGPRAPRHGRAVVIKAGHKHTAHCGHFQHKGAWFHSTGHKHGPGCGHHLRGNIWIRL